MVTLYLWVFQNSNCKNTLESYPYLVLQELKAQYPYAGVWLTSQYFDVADLKKRSQRFDRILIHKAMLSLSTYALEWQKTWKLSSEKSDGNQWQDDLESGYKNHSLNSFYPTGN